MAAAPVSYGIGVKNRYAFLDDTTDDGNIKLAHLNSTHIKSVHNNNLLTANNHQISKQQHHHKSNVNNNKKQHDVMSDKQLNSHQSNQSQQNTKKSHVNNNQSQKTTNPQQQSIDFNKRTNNNTLAHDKINSSTNNKSHTNTPKGQQTINSGSLNNDNTANRKYQSSYNENKSQSGADNSNNNNNNNKSHTNTPKGLQTINSGPLDNVNTANRKHQSSFNENKSQSGADNTNNNDELPTKPSAPKYRRRPSRGTRGRPTFAGRGRREDGERKDVAPEAPTDAPKGPPDGRPPMRRGRGGFGGRGGRGARMNGEERRPREDDRRHQKPIPNFKDNLMFPSLAP